MVQFFKRPKLLVILGPTATGKTDIALFLAKKFRGELVSCDSRQVYTGLDIGTGKLPSKNSKFEIRNSKLKKQNGMWVVNGVNIWMYDVVSPRYQYSVADYVQDAGKVVDGIFKREKLPIVVGGTGLYLKALLEGLSNLSIPVDQNLRIQLETFSLMDLQNKLQEISPQRWKKMNYSDRQNPRRLVRAIEIVILRAKPEGSLADASISETSSEILRGVYTERSRSAQNDVLKIGLTAPREILYKRVDERVISRINQGMIEEVKSLYENGLTIERMKQLGLEYGILSDYLIGRLGTLKELIQVMQYQIHGYVRRQLTWFKKEKDVLWFDIEDKNYISKIEKQVAKWYDSK